MMQRIATAILVAIAACPAAQAAEIHLRRECACAGALATLGDVADIYADDEDHARQLARIELFPAPPPGQVRRVPVREIYDLLAARGVDLRKNRLAGASSTAVAGTVAKTDSPVLKPPPRIEAAAPDSAGLVPVVVAVRPLARGELVREADVEVAARPAPPAGSDLAGDLSEVIGREATRFVGAGQVLPRAALQPPRLVRKNETVTLLVRANGIQVRTSAKALEDGGLDDLVALESLLDRKTRYTARVAGYKEAEILAGGPQVRRPRTTPHVPPAAGALGQKAESTIAPGRKPSPFALRVRDEDAVRDQ